jgi:hypothetical protein
MTCRPGNGGGGDGSGPAAECFSDADCRAEYFCVAAHCRGANGGDDAGTSGGGDDGGDAGLSMDGGNGLPDDAGPSCRHTRMCATGQVCYEYECRAWDDAGPQNDGAYNCQTCTPGAQRWCDAPTGCLWGQQTCDPNGTWGSCREVTARPLGCEHSLTYDWSCCVVSGGCCERFVPGDHNHESVGACLDPSAPICAMR